MGTNRRPFFSTARRRPAIDLRDLPEAMRRQAITEYPDLGEKGKTVSLDCSAREVVFVFPSLPPAALYQNKVESTHWRTRHKAAKEARAEAWARALYMHPSDWRRNGSRMFAHPFETCEVEIAVTVPDKRRRDLNGILSAVKSYLDGLADAGVFPDDDYTHVQRLSATVTYIKGKSETRIIVRER